MRNRGLILAFVLAFTISGLTAADLGSANGNVIEFTEDDVKAVVESHNQIRSQNITPSASDMRNLSWDPSLAEFSQKWTSNCEYGFKENSATELWEEVGQSFFLATAAWHIDFHFSSVLKWLDQKSLYNYENGSCSEFCGHYRQLAFADTYKVGCAASFCPVVTAATSDTEIANATFYMCAYYPPAPREGEYQPYTQGPACTNCSDPTDKCNDLELCSSAQRAKPLTKSTNGESQIPNPPSTSSMAITVTTVVASSAALLLGITAAVIKMNKGRTVEPSAPPPPANEVAEEPNVGNGKAPTNPVESGES